MAENPLKMSKSQHHRCFGMREAITITVGTVIGVGLFTVGANVVGLMGPAVILCTLTAMLISIYPSLLYAEMGAILPYAGGTYQYASIGLGRPFGMLAGWNFIISMVSVASGEAIAFSFYLRTLIEAFGLSLPVSDTIIACLVVMLFLILSIRGIEMTGRLQNGFMFFFWGVAIVWVLTMLPKMTLSLFASGLTGFSLHGFFPCVAMVWWCFAGFETCCAMGEEIRHPQINIPRAMFLAPFIVFAVNGLFQWVLLCIVPYNQLEALGAAAAPYAYAMETAGIIGFPLILLCAGIAFGGDFSTLNASMAAPARYLFTMARDGVLPKFLARIHSRFQTPYIAILLLGLLILLLISTNSLYYIASLSLFATLFYYVIGIAAAWGLRKKASLLYRPYRVPAIWIGAPLSILIYLFMMTQLEEKAIIAGLLWSIIGLLLYFICTKHYYHSSDEKMQVVPFTTEPIPVDEKKRMDREYHVWCTIVILAVSLVIGLFICSFLL